MAEPIVHDAFLIGGDWVAPQGTATIDVVNPSTEELFGRVPEGTTADVDAAVAAARQAFDAGPWPTMSPKERGAVVAAVSGAITADMQGIAELLAGEMGSPVSWATMGQVFAPTLIADQYVGLADTYPFTDIRAGMLGPSEVRKVPVGVVAAVIPWNVPLFAAIIKLAPALVAGCTVVLKPAPETPLSAYVLGQLLLDAGLPAGVVNIVPAGREVGEHLVTHPGVDKVSFTGSTAVGRHIGGLCGQLLRPVTLELGGKSAAIVLDDADLAAAVAGIVPNGVMNNGQACVAQTRILASRDRYSEVVDAVSEAVGALTVGDALDPATEVGPLVAERQRERVLGYLDIGREEGARVTVGGGRPAGQDRGWFVEPTVFADATNEMRIAREEIFGPVLTVIPYDDVDDAVRIANDSDYGLSGSVWGGDHDAAADVGRRIRTGTMNINTFMMDMCSPFGGFKASGMGRELGPEGLEAYLLSQTIAHAPQAEGRRMALPSPRDPDELTATLTGWLSDRAGSPVTVTAAGGPPTTGFSNETILCDADWDGAQHRLVFRVQPTQHTVFPHDLFEVQHRVMTALGQVDDPALPVPTLRWYEEDDSVLGAPFMVMDRVDGEAPCDSPPYTMEGWMLEGPPELQRAVWERGLDAMAAVHRVDWTGLGLGDLDPCPDGGSRLGARVDAWADFLEWASPGVRQEVPELGIAWLRENQPPDIDDVALCWGDSRIGNQLFADRTSADAVHVAAVLDWEMVHVGDPVQDLGWFTWLDHTLSAGLDLPRLPGLPSIPETTERWEAATGRSAEHHRWAEINAGVGFAVVMVRLTALLKGSEIFPQDSDFERTNMACVALERALAAMDVHPSDLA